MAVAQCAILAILGFGADAGDPLRPHCIVHPPTDIKFVSETRPIILPASAIQMRAIDGSIERLEIVR